MPAVGNGVGSPGRKIKKRKKPSPMGPPAPRTAPVAGDSPKNRQADVAKANAYKQTQPYIDTLKKARGDAHPNVQTKTVTIRTPMPSRGRPATFGVSQKKVTTVTKGAAGAALNDKAYFAKHIRAGYKADASKPVPPPPARYTVDPSTGTARKVTTPKAAPAKAQKPDLFDKAFGPKEDRPRTDPEVRKFLKDGKRPYSKYDTGLDKGAIGAADLKLVKVAAKPLHGVIGTLEGKNPIKATLHGTDTGSDLVRHYLHNRLGKFGTALLGEGINWFADPVGHGKLSIRSPQEALLRKAGRQEIRGNAIKAASLRAKATTASTNRGVQLGVRVAGVPLTGKRFDPTTSGEGTARLSKILHLPQAGHALHDSPAVQKLGKAMVPHFRPKDVPPATHAKHVAALRKKIHGLHAADRLGERRATAYHNARQAVSDEDKTLAGVAENAPKGDTPDFKYHKERSPEHVAKAEATRKERSARRKVAVQQGRANFETAQQRAGIRRKLTDTLRGRDRAMARMDAEGTGHSAARQRHAEIAVELKGVEKSMAKVIGKGLKKPADAKRLEELRIRHEALTKFRAGLEHEWGTFPAGAESRVATDGTSQSPSRTLKPLDNSIADIETELAPLRAKAQKAKDLGTASRNANLTEVKGSGRMIPKRRLQQASQTLSKAETKQMAGLERRLKRFEDERHHAAVEPHVRRYLRAGAEAKASAVKYGNARKAHRNAHGVDARVNRDGDVIYSNLHPSTGKPIVGGYRSHTDEMRDKATEDFHETASNHLQAQENFRAATAGLEAQAEKQASAVARRAPGDATPLAAYDRLNPTTLRHLDDAKAEAAAAKAVRDKAEGAARGIPQHREVFRETERVNGKRVPVKGGQTWEEYLAGADKYTKADLTPGGQVIVEQHSREMTALHARLRTAGLLDEPIPNYLHHMHDERTYLAKLNDVKEALKNKGGRPANAPLTRARLDPRPAIVQNQHRAAEQFETNIARIDANYIRDANRALADAHYLKSVTAMGEPLTKSSFNNLRDTQRVYAISPKSFKELDTEDAEAYLRGTPTKAGAHVILPKSIGDGELRVRKGMDSSNIFGEGADAFHRFWKSAVTVYNMPFYQQRNFYDDSLRFWYGDGDVKSFGEAMGLMKQHVHLTRGERHLIPGYAVKGQVRIGGRAMDSAEFLKWAEEDGVLGAGHFAADFEGGMRKVGRATVLNPTTGIRNAGAIGEDIPRLASYLSALRKGMTREQAASWVRIHHFDYTEITADERILRRVIPFWTFTSRNVALQARTAFTRPGKFSQFEAFREEMAKLAGLPPDWDEKYIDSTQQRALPVPVRFGTNKDGTPNIKIYYPSFSNTDLNRLPLFVGPKDQHNVWDTTVAQANQMLAQLTPIIKAPMEMFFNHSWFFNQAIYRDTKNTDAPHWVPAPPAAKRIPGISQLMTRIVDPRTKQMVDAWPAWFDYMIKQFPQSGFAATVFTPGQNNRGQTSGDRLSGQVTGLRRTTLTGLPTNGKPDTSRGRAEFLRHQLAVDEVKSNDRRDQGKRADRKVPSYLSVTDSKITADKKARQDELDKINGTVDSVRLRARPKTSQQQEKDRVAKRKLGYTAEATQAKKKAARERLRIQAIVNRTGR